MIRRRVTISNPLGLHMRACNVFADAASRFSSAIHVVRGGLKVNGKSIMGLMMLAADLGSEIAIEASGLDEQAALDELIRLVEDGFGEGRGGDGP